MRRIARVLLGCLALLLLSGCSSVANVTPDYSFAQAKADGQGLLIGSITTDTQASGYGVKTFFYISTKPDSDQTSVYLLVDSGCGWAIPGASDFDSFCGKLFAVSLPKGQYYISTWKEYIGQFPVVPPKSEWQPIPFFIEPGKATYIGNIHMNLVMADRAQHIDIGWPNIRDGSTRDLPMLEAKYPTITPEVIDYEPLQIPVMPGADGAKASAKGSDAREGFVQQMRVAIDVKTRYPREVTDQRAEAVVVVSFDYSGDGRATDIQVDQSSGNTYLDAAAIKAVTDAILPPKPPGLSSVTHFVFNLNFEP